MRAPRFSLQLPVRYRPVGETMWLDGTTENVSRSGVFFRGAKPLDVDTPIEIDITLAATPLNALSDVVGKARVVRIEERPATPITLAAQFSSYRIVPSRGRD